MSDRVWRDVKYILNADHVAVPVDLLTWGRWLEENGARRIVRQDRFPDGVRVSTVFIGLDHNWDPAGPRHIFETMVFGGAHDQAQERYATWAQAEAGHAAMLARVRGPEDA